MAAAAAGAAGTCNVKERRLNIDICSVIILQGWHRALSMEHVCSPPPMYVKKIKPKL